MAGNRDRDRDPGPLRRPGDLVGDDDRRPAVHQSHRLGPAGGQGDGADVPIVMDQHQEIVLVRGRTVGSGDRRVGPHRLGS